MQPMTSHTTFQVLIGTLLAEIDKVSPEEVGHPSQLAPSPRSDPTQCWEVAAQCWEVADPACRLPDWIHIPEV